MRMLLVALVLTSVVQGTPPKSTANTGNTDEAYVFERLRTSYRFENDGTSRRETEAVIRIQSEAGVQAFGQLVFGYNASTEKIEIVYARVKKPDGSIINASTNAIQDLSSPVQQRAPVYTDFREKHVTVRGLRPGETLEYKTVTLTHTALAAGHFWAEHDFQRDDVVLDEQLWIDLPADRPVLLKTADDAVPEVSTRDGRRLHHWTSSHLARDRTAKAVGDGGDDEDTDEPRRAAVRLTTFRNWAEFGAWYRSIERGPRTITAAVRAKALALTAGRTSDVERLEALYDFVAPNFRYVSISLGRGRFQARSAADVLRDQYGDCKDKHTLLAAMMESVGLRASTVLINSSTKIDPDFPSPTEFDHVLTLAHLPSLEAWMDVTTEIAPFRLLSPNLRRKQALVISTTEPARLVDTPADPPVLSLVTTDVEATLGAAGALAAQVKLAVRGDAELMLRYIFRSAPAAEWKNVVKGLSAMSGIDGEVSDWTVSDPAATREPFRVTFKVAKTSAVNWARKQDTLSLPFSDMPLGYSSDTAKVLNVGAPGRVEYRFRLQLGAGYQGRAPLPVSVTRDYATYEATYTLEGQQFTAHRQLDLRVGSLPGDRRGDYRSFRRVVTTDEGQVLALEIAPPAIGSAVPDLKASELLRSGRDSVKSGNYTQAVTLLKRGLELEPKHKQGWNDLGDAYLGLRQFTESIDAYNKQLEVNPFDEHVHNDIGYAYRIQRRYWQAEKEFRKQLELNPLDSFAHASLGAMLIEMKRFDDAILELEKAVALPSPRPEWYVELGTANLKAGRDDRALASYARAVELSPTPVTWNSVAHQLTTHGVHLDRAVQYAEAAVAATSLATRDFKLEKVTARDLALVDSLGNYWDTLGWAFFAKGDLARAEKLVRASWRLSQWGWAGDLLGQIMEKKQLPDEARRLYAAALHSEYAEPETNQRLLRLSGAFAFAVAKNYAQEPLKLRTFKLPAQKATHGNADFFVLLGDDGRPLDVKFIKGDASLSALAEVLRSMQLGDATPEGGAARIIRRGTLACAAEGCTFTLDQTSRTKPE